MPLPGMRSADTEVYSELKIIAVDKGVPSQQARVKLLVDSGVKKTLLSEADWKKIKEKAGNRPPKLKICKTKFRPFGTDIHLPILRRSKCTLQAAAGAEIRTIV